jgi:hypothetical protein
MPAPLSPAPGIPVPAIHSMPPASAGDPGAGPRCSVVMSGSSEADPEAGEGSAWVAGVAAQRGGDVDRPRPTEHPDHQVPQDRHGVGGGAGGVATGKVCQQPVAGKAMGLPVGAAAPSSVTVTAVRLPARPRAGRLARRAANTARPATTVRAAASMPSETTSQPDFPIGPGARGQRRTPRPHAQSSPAGRPASCRPRAARRPWRADGRHQGSRRSTSQRVDELAA